MSPSFTPLHSLLRGPSVLGRSAPQPSVQGRASDVVGFPWLMLQQASSPFSQGDLVTHVR